MLLSRTLAESKEMLATTLRSIGDAVLTTDLEGHITFINPMAELLSGWRAEEALGRQSAEVFLIFDETTDETVKCPVVRVLESETATGYSNHTYLQSRDGTRRTIAYNATPIRDEEGEIFGVVLIFHSARTPAKTDSGTDRFELIARATNDAVWDWDLITGRVCWNDAISTLFGYAPEDVESSIEWIFKRIHRSDAQGVRDNLDAARRDGRRYWQREYRFKCANGSYSAVLERGYIIRDPVGRPVRAVGTMMDITERREAQEELLRINAELEQRIEERTAELRQANKELESFTYSVSHDLRTPLRNILASTELLQSDTTDHLDDEARGTLTRLVSSAKRMSHLIDDLLQYSRLARSGLKLDAVDVSAVARGVASELRRRSACGASIEVQDGMVEQADEGLITILYENLIDNACKFSGGRPGARIEVGRTEVRGEKVYFVRDNGVGFESEDAVRLFQPFERLHDEREFPGTGIGLANCDRIVRRHGGRIWAEGRPGDGATFYFTL
jgi:PAS domain S-box-containing protein